MNTGSSSDNTPKKTTMLPGYARSIFHLLRLFWPTLLALLVTVGWGLLKSWSKVQWSNGLFYSAAIQIIFSAPLLFAPTSEAVDASSLRYVPNSDVAEVRSELFQDKLRRRKFGLRVFFGALLTFLVSTVIALI